MIKFSVLLCSRNRSSSLFRTLNSIVDSNIPECNWELIVVDNGSSDNTAEIVSKFCNLLPIRYLNEPTPGLSIARNRGVLAARGQYIIWTDDDVVVDKGWLMGYLDAFTAWPTAALFAGQIHPKLEQPQVDWFAAGRAHLASLMAVREFSEVVPLSSELVPFGANYAVRATDQKRHLYDPNLGVAPGRRRGGEETAVAKAILAEGALGITVPSSIVSHMIPVSRQSLSYVQEYYVAAGQESPLEEPEKRGRLIAGAPYWIYRQKYQRKISYLLKRLIGKDWLPDFIYYSLLEGKRRCWRSYRNKSQLTASVIY